MRIVTPESKRWEEAAARGFTRDAVRRTVRRAGLSATQKLPPVSEFLTVMVSPDEAYNTIKETGDGGITFSEEYISIVFDYHVPFGAEALHKRLRATAMHEMAHAASYLHAGPWIPAPLQAVVYEGLATVFEKQYNVPPLWASYENDLTMHQWLEEIKTLPTDTKNFDYLYDHPDGRRWVIYKTGTWMIEKLLAAGNYTFNDLIKMPHEKVLAAFERRDK